MKIFRRRQSILCLSNGVVKFFNHVLNGAHHVTILLRTQNQSFCILVCIHLSSDGDPSSFEAAVLDVMSVIGPLKQRGRKLCVGVFFQLVLLGDANHILAKCIWIAGEFSPERDVENTPLGLQSMEPWPLCVNDVGWFLRMFLETSRASSCMWLQMGPSHCRQSYGRRMLVVWEMELIFLCQVRIRQYHLRNGMVVYQYGPHAGMTDARIGRSWVTIHQTSAGCGVACGAEDKEE